MLRPSRRTWFTTSSKVFSSKQWTMPKGYDTNISIYNSLTRSKVPLILPRNNLLYWYMCGPTVYDEAHIGHASSYIKFDIIRRILENFFDINVVQLMGITDIDDKIIAKSRENNVEFWQVARKYENEFFKDLRDLNILPPSVSLRVSDVIPDIIKFITKIHDRQFAYKTEDGSVYFNVTKYGSEYGKLAPVTAVDNANLETENPFKENAMDFALWKATKPEEPWWDSPWGRGRPGWHIECSTMASLLFGENIDFHSGGIDLLFPHHENELAQSCAFHSTNQWINYWLHSGHLHWKKEKMSKSLKNVITIQKFLSENSADELRIFCLRSHYRNHIEYSPGILDEAIAITQRLQSFLAQINAYVYGQLQCDSFDEVDLANKLQLCKTQNLQALANDFDTNKAVENLLEFMSYVNKKFNTKPTTTVVRSPSIVAAIGNYVENFFKNLGVSLHSNSTTENFKYLDNVIESTVKFRKEVRLLALDYNIDVNMNKETRKNLLKACDQLRSELEVAGVKLKVIITYNVM